MTKFTAFIAALAIGAAASPTVGATDIYPTHHGVEYRVLAGFNIGASAPMGIPAEIRKIEGYRPTLNLAIGADVTRMFSEKWGLNAGLLFETKGMSTRIEAKNYHLTMNITAGDDTGSKTGYFTGRIKNETKVAYVTIPVAAVFRPHRHWQVQGGLYFSYAFDRTFTGQVSDGKMREDPLHPAIGVSHAEYDYSSDIRRFDTGLTIGATRRIYRSLAISANLRWGFLSTLSPSTRKVDMDTYNIYLNLALSYAI